MSTKGPISPGAVDIARRIEVLDRMEIAGQLMFPTSIRLWGTLLSACPEDLPLYKRFGDKSASYAEQLFAANNEWAVQQVRISPRIRPVTPVCGDTPEELIAATRRLVDRGVRAVLPVSSKLPGNVSTAHEDLDPFYAMLAEAKVALTLHTGGELYFFRTSAWGKSKAFEGNKVNEETSMDPWRLSVLHFAPQNFIATMITGGVFDRHPALRVGVLEYGAHWVGPMAMMLDLWHDNNTSIGLREFADGSVSRKLPMRPSEYLQRKVGVAPVDFEPSANISRWTGWKAYSASPAITRMSKAARTRSANSRRRWIRWGSGDEEVLRHQRQASDAKLSLRLTRTQRRR